MQVLEISLVINCDGLHAAKTSLDDFVFVIFYGNFYRISNLTTAEKRTYRAKF